MNTWKRKPIMTDTSSVILLEGDGKWVSWVHLFLSSHHRPGCGLSPERVLEAAGSNCNCSNKLQQHIPAVWKVFFSLSALWMYLRIEEWSMIHENILSPVDCLSCGYELAIQSKHVWIECQHFLFMLTEYRLIIHYISFSLEVLIVSRNSESLKTALSCCKV